MRKPEIDAPCKEFNGIRSWVKKHNNIKTGKPLDEGDYRKHLSEKYGK
jgi:hypothetical protein